VRPERVLERRHERRIDLDDVHVRASRREVLAQHAEPAADFEDDVAGSSAGRALDHAEDVRVDQEVLAEVALRADAEATQPAQRRLRWQAAGRIAAGRAGHGAHHPNSSAALRSTTRSSSS
jgi:hypothetical protein